MDFQYLQGFFVRLGILFDLFNRILCNCIHCRWRFAKITFSFPDAKLMGYSTFTRFLMERFGMIKFDTTDPATNTNKKLDHNKFNSKTATDIVRNTS